MLSSLTLHAAGAQGPNGAMMVRSDYGIKIQFFPAHGSTWSMSEDSMRWMGRYRTMHGQTTYTPSGSSICYNVNGRQGSYICTAPHSHLL